MAMPFGVNVPANGKADNLGKGTEMRKLIQSLITAIKEKVAKDEGDTTATFNELLSALKGTCDCEFLHNKSSDAVILLMELAGFSGEEGTS